jgi:hypothetical protein
MAGGFPNTFFSLVKYRIHPIQVFQLPVYILKRYGLPRGNSFGGRNLKRKEKTMSQLLYIQASPRGERSHPIAVADAFVSSYRKANPAGEIITTNLFNREMPFFDGHVLNAKYNIMHGLDHSAEEPSAWRRVEAIIDEFKAADKYVLREGGERKPGRF